MSVQSYRDRLAEFFRARPGEWIDGVQLSQVAGLYAWRTRCSDLQKLGMTIENRKRKVTNFIGRRYTVSEYRYVPPPEAEQQTLPMETRA